MKKALLVLFSILIIAGFWQVSEDVINDYRIQKGETSIEVFIASPQAIIKTFVEDGGLIFSQLSYTIFRAVVGLFFAIILAAGVSILFFTFPVIRHVLFPLNFAINSFPIVGFAPVIILTFGQGSWFSIVFISMIISYFPILVGLDNAFRNIDNDIIEVMKVFNATKWQLLIKVYLPYAFPGFLTSLKLALPASIIGATIGEWLGTRNGIGQLITMSLYQLRPGLLYASLISVTLSGIIFVALLFLLEKRLLPWRK